MYITQDEIVETLTMVQKQNLDVRTITLGLSLRSCADRDINVATKHVYEKIVRAAENLVRGVEVGDVALQSHGDQRGGDAGHGQQGKDQEQAALAGGVHGHDCSVPRQRGLVGVWAADPRFPITSTMSMPSVTVPAIE